ncbi:MAG TPA: anhydro-N-acetylmuramic acid kinase [Micromonosporaceae bacterium]
MISGTSHDGVDVAVVDFAVTGDTLHGGVRYAASTPYPDELRERLMRALPPAEVTLAEVCALDTLIGQAFADAACAALDRSGGADLVCSHGQTVYHWVDAGRVLGTLQIGQPAWIAERTGLPVVADLRSRDVAAGGQGAPLVAVLDLMLLAGLPGRAAALNLGGIANITVPRPPGGGAPVAYDTGPANALIDAAAIRASGGRLRFDVDGRLAAAGRVDDDLLDDLLADPYYALPAPKTTGKELFHAGYLDRVLARHPGLPDEDVVATVTALTAAAVAAEVRRYQVDTLIASGGGCANPTLMAMLARRLDGVRIGTADTLGVRPDAKEAVAFALLGWLTAHGLAGDVPSCTGSAGGRVLGAIVPGREPLRLPEPRPARPQALTLSPDTR